MSMHFIDLLDGLKQRLARMTAQVQQSLEVACEAILTVDPRLAAKVVEIDKKIDEEEVKVEKQAIDLLALHQPAAVDLRLITTIIKVNSEFERIADCAVNIAQRVEYLQQVERYEPPAEMRAMCNAVIATLRDTIKAFNLADEAQARQVLRSDDLVDALYHQIVLDMIGEMESGSAAASTDLSNIMIAKNLERIGDHCTNIAENVVYIHTGHIIRHTHATE
jgi:phosphate transport system protein